MACIRPGSYGPRRHFARQLRCLEIEQAGDDLEVIAGLVMDFLDQSIPIRQGRFQVGCALIDLTLQCAGQVVELLIALRQTAGRNFQLLQSDAELLFGIGGFGLARGETGFQQTDRFLIPQPLPVEHFVARSALSSRLAVAVSWASGRCIQRC